MALFFQYPIHKTCYMPNSQNRNAGDNNNSKGQPKHDMKAPTEKPNPERSDLKDGVQHPKNSKGDTSRSSSQGRKSSSGGRIED